MELFRENNIRPKIVVKIPKEKVLRKDSFSIILRSKIAKMSNISKTHNLLFLCGHISMTVPVKGKFFDKSGMPF